MAEKVDQDVREAAGNVWVKTWGKSHMENRVMAIFKGAADNEPLVQAFARMKEAGRQQGLREAAEVVMAHQIGADERGDSATFLTQGIWTVVSQSCGQIAAAITALMDGENRAA